MQASWQRWIPLTGVLFVVLFVVSLFLIGPDDEDINDEALLAWYADSGNQTGAIIGAYLLAVAGVAMLLFMNRLRVVVGGFEAGRPVFAPFILAGATVFVSSLAVAAATFAAVPAGVKFGGEDPATNADLVKFLPHLGWGAMLVIGMFPLIFAIFTTAIASMRFGIFPAWFNWLSIVCGLVLFLAALFLPLIALGVWLLAGSWLLMKQQPGTSPAP